MFTMVDILSHCIPRWCVVAFFIGGLRFSHTLEIRHGLLHAGRTVANGS